MGNYYPNMPTFLRRAIVQRITIAAGGLLFAGGVEGARGQGAPPPGWRWSTDGPANLTAEWNTPDAT